VPKCEVAGVPERLREEFSSRTTNIEAAKDILVEGFVGSHGRQHSAREVLKLRQQATLAARPDKHVRPLADLVHRWHGRAQEVLGSDPVSWVETLAGRNDLPLLLAGDLPRRCSPRPRRWRCEPQLSSVRARPGPRTSPQVRAPSDEYAWERPSRRSSPSRG
jgi:hypothetical protein